MTGISEAQPGTSSTGTQVSISSVSMRFTAEHGEVQALEDVSLTVRENEFVCLMGPSGCGKTTLMNAVAGLVQPTSGRIEVGGAVVSGTGADRAVVFQDDAVFPWMTVEANVGFSATVRGKPKAEIERIVNHYLGLVGLEQFRRAWPRQLSGGMRKRVDLARGFATDSSVLLLDEPFGALDIMTKEYLQEELLRLWRKEPRTILFVTHDLEEALFLGDRVVLMTPRPGRIEAIYEAGFPEDRDMSFKVDDRFVELRREIRERMTEGGKS
ncbi:MAG: sulfonate transport system ATP-binding protein [Thermoleophilaceae bacterium]|jgi:NitT/TauT family transport system ATP-binding protein|nr:sulfonate transport system ATP-binding protein [Thermoleophilaceae bacterium]